MFYLQILNAPTLWTTILLTFMIGILNPIIVRNFDIHYNEILFEAKYLCLWLRNVSDDSSRTTGFSLTDKILIVAEVVILTINNLHYLFNDVLLLIDSIPLWLTSLQFRHQINLEIGLSKFSNKSNYKSPNLYRKICKLSRGFGRIHGLHLLYYFLYSTLYYSSTLDEIFLPEGLGYNFFRIQYMGIMLLFQWISSNFYKNVNNISYSNMA